MVERRKKLLTAGDIDEVADRIIETIKLHGCTRGLTDEDAVFLRKLRRGSDTTAAIVWRCFLGALGLGLLMLIVGGFVVAGYQLLHEIK